MQHFRGWIAALALAAVSGSLGAPTLAQAQQGQVWIQIEARNTLGAAEDRARQWSNLLGSVSGFALASGWYAIALGPFAGESEAAAQLGTLRAQGAIPNDSFLADTRLFRGQFWPSGAEPLAAPAPIAPVETAPLDQPAPDLATPTAEPAPPLETLADARAHEAGLSRNQRMDIQRALQWAGTYTSGIDGAFGPGTRNSIAEWQTAQGRVATGWLTPSEFATLVEGWQAEVAALGLDTVRDEEAGIKIDLPLGLVAFDRYTPPFAQYVARGDSGLQIWLISQPGGAAALPGLYDLVQSLNMIPPDGPRALGSRGFEIQGLSATTEAYARVDVGNGGLRGFVVSGRAADSSRMVRVLQAMKTSFAPIGTSVLDPGLVALDETTRTAFQSGVAPNRPAQAGSGFWADSQGSVLTAAGLVASCGRITLDGGIEARVSASDAAAGYALLTPAKPQAPAVWAKFASALPAPGQSIAVAGYSFGSDLPLPSMTFGQFEAPVALDGTPGRARVSLPALPGDAGGPVLGPDGQVIGILQPREQDSARVLPATVQSMAPVQVMTIRGGTLPLTAPAPGQLAPEDLTAIGTDLAVQVNCWK